MFSLKSSSCAGCDFNDPAKGLRSKMRTVEGTNAALEGALSRKKGQVARLKKISSEKHFHQKTSN